MIDISDTRIFLYEILYLVINFSFLFGSKPFRKIFEFFMYAGRDTHRFRRQYDKNSFWKKELMITVFDETWVKESKYQKQMKTLFWAHYIFKFITFILFILRCIFTFNKSIPVWFAVVSSIYFGSYIIFILRIFGHSIDNWRQWFKKYPKVGDFRMRLPDEKPKKKRRKNR